MNNITIASLLVATLVAAPAHSQTIAPEVRAGQTETVPGPANTELAPESERSLSPILTENELDDQRGGESIVITNQSLTAITSGNIINGDYSAGDVSLSDSALSSFNGVGNLLINTGAQVSLQTGMNLTININD